MNNDGMCSDSKDRESRRKTKRIQERVSHGLPVLGLQAFRNASVVNLEARGFFLSVSSSYTHTFYLSQPSYVVPSGRGEEGSFLGGYNSLTIMYLVNTKYLQNNVNSSPEFVKKIFCEKNIFPLCTKNMFNVENH